MKIHIVKKGDTLWKIAQRYNLDFEKLKEFNTQLENPDKISQGMKIKIPTNSVPISSQFPQGTQLQNVSEKKIAPEPTFQLPPEELAPTPIPEPAPAPAPFMQAPIQEFPPAPEPFMQAPFQEFPPAPVPAPTPTPQASPYMPMMPMMPIMPPMMPQFAPFPFCPPMKPHHDHCSPPPQHFPGYPMEPGEMDFNPFQQNPHMMYSPFPYPYMQPMPFQSGMPGMALVD